MVYAYVRVSTDKQSIKNQEYEIDRYVEDNGSIKVDKWIIAQRILIYILNYLL